MASKSQGTTVEHQCSIKSCTKEAHQICSGCKTARYCSKDCQKVHWIAGHKTECRSPKSPEAERRNVPVVPPPYKIVANPDGTVTERRMISLTQLEELAAYEKKHGVNLLAKGKNLLGMDVGGMEHRPR